MKNLFLFLVAVLFFSSCTMEKKHYRNGWYWQTNSKCRNEKTVPALITKTESNHFVSFSVINPTENKTEELVQEKIKTDSVAEKTSANDPELKLVLPDTSVQKNKKPKPDFRYSKTRLIYNESYMFGIGLAFVSLLYLALIIVICFLGTPFLAYLFLLALLAPLTAIWAWSKLENSELWKKKKGVGRILGWFFYYSSIGIAFLFSPILLLLLAFGWITYLILNAIYLLTTAKRRRSRT